MKKYIDIGTIGDFIRDEWLDPLNMSQNALAKAIGVPQNRINEIINGKRGITVDTDLRLCKYFNVSAGMFLGIQSDFERILARRRIEKDLAKIVPYANDNADGKNDLMEM